MNTIFYKNQYINININTNHCYVVFNYGNDFIHVKYNSFIGAKRGITKFNAKHNI